MTAAISATALAVLGYLFTRSYRAESRRIDEILVQFWDDVEFRRLDDHLDEVAP